MARISLVGRSRTSGAAKEAFERKIAKRGNIPNMYRVFAHRPWLLTTMDAHFAAVMGSGTVPLKLKEMLALQTSLENRSRYCSASHTILAERTGSTPGQIAALRDVEGGPFSEREKAALRFGLPLDVLLEIVRVYADAMGRASDAVTRAFHLHVHDQFRV